MFFWFSIAIAVVTYLISSGKLKRKGNICRRKTNYQPPKRESYDRTPEVAREQSVAERQLVTVRSNEFYKRPLMNKSEYGVFYRLEKLLSASHRGYRVFSQVSLGEILGWDDKQVYLAINIKVADFVIIDWSGQPIAVVEYHCSSHFKDDAIVRDSVKCEACRNARYSLL